MSVTVRLLRQLRVGGSDPTRTHVKAAVNLVACCLGWHENPLVVAWWRARLGPLLRWLTPNRRRLLLGCVAVLIGTRELWKVAASVKGLPLESAAIVPALILTASLMVLCFAASAHFAALPGVIRRHPQLTLHGVFWGLLLGLWSTPADAPALRHTLAGVALMLPLVLWRMGYLLLSAQRGKVCDTRFTHHLIYLFPLQVGWFAFLPFGKGLDYLRRHEAQDETALARSQLAGIKLILLAGVWMVALSIMQGLLYGSPNWAHRALGGAVAISPLPAFGQLLAQGAAAPLWQSWVSIYLELVRRVLLIAVLGHGVVGLLRLFGFNIFRNTYKPLLAETVSQFWARLEFYYKELLVDFFFLPTFAKWFRRWPALRTFAAVFAAAVIGNMYCHLVDLDQGALVLLDWRAVWSHHSRLLYCVLLAVGIFVSMQREQRRGGRGLRAGLVPRVGRILTVWTFFALIRIWDHFPEVSFTTRTQFFFSLFGLA